MPAKNQQPKSVLSQLQSVGEDAIEKFTQNPAARSALKGAINLKDRGNNFVSGLLDIEKRLKAVEKRLAALEHQTKGGPTTATRKTSSAASKTRKTAAKPRTTASAAKSSTTSTRSSNSSS